MRTYLPSQAGRRRLTAQLHRKWAITRSTAEPHLRIYAALTYIQTTYGIVASTQTRQLREEVFRVRFTAKEWIVHWMRWTGRRGGRCCGRCGCRCCNGLCRQVLLVLLWWLQVNALFVVIVIMLLLLLMIVICPPNGRRIKWRCFQIVCRTIMAVL